MVTEIKQLRIAYYAILSCFIYISLLLPPVGGNNKLYISNEKSITLTDKELGRKDH